MSTLKTTNIAHPSSANNNIVLDSSARVLVGTSTARTAANTTAQAQVEGTGWQSSSLSLFCNSTSATDFGGLYLGRSKGSSIGSVTSVASSDYLGLISFVGTDGTNGISAAQIRAEVDGTPGTNSMPGRIVLSTTASGASSPTERMRITSGTSNGANILFNCTSFPSSSVKGTAIAPNSSVGNCLTNGVNVTTACAHLEFYNPNGSVGSIQTNGSSTSYLTSSDYRLKENVEPVTDSITRLQQLKPSRFNFIADPDKKIDGFIAHEVQTVVPEAIIGEKDAVDDDGNPIYQGIDQSKLVPLLTAALQKAIAKIETLEARLTAAGIA